MIKKFCKLFLLVVALFVGATITNAEAVKETLTISNYTIGSEPIIFPDVQLNSTVNFHVKKTAEGKYVYCMHYSKKPPVKSITYTKGTQITDKGILFLISNGLNATNDAEFFQYQTALWIYLVETNQMEGTHHDIDRFIKTIDGNTDATSKHIRAMVEFAKTFSYTLAEKPTISVNDNNVTFTLKDGYYVSSNITVNSSEGADYTVNLTSAPSNSTVEKHDNYFIVKVPQTSVTQTTKVTFTVSNSKEIYTSYYYNPSNSNYQKMAVTYKEPASASDNGSATITKDQVITKIVKVDAATNEPLKGATLELTNSNGKIVRTWISNGTPEEFKDLAPGTYTLIETNAPKGYVKSDAKVIFKIDANGNLTDQSGNKLEQVTFGNDKEEIVTGVKISKQDITNKKELKGATLIIKDENGKVIKEFVSSNEPTFFELKPGKYTLTEKIAPKGYILSTETINFTVKEDGTIETVVMYNEPEKVVTGVNISKQDITNKKELPGATLTIKDYDGNIIKEFVSGNEPTFFELKPGIYTLSETVQPEGYILSTETITFTVKEDGKIETVVMYNEPQGKEVIVENTASFKTVATAIIGLIASLIGVSLIFKKPKNLV